MWPLCVVHSDQVFDDAFGLRSVRPFMQINGFLVQIPAHAFDEEIVEIPAAAVHWDLRFGINQCGDPIRVCELQPPGCVHDLGIAIYLDGLLQSIDTETCMQSVGLSPCRYFACRIIQHCNQIEDPVPDRLEGDITVPNVVGYVIESFLSRYV